MELVEHFYYTKEHEWINIEDNTGIVGITQYAQEALGEITYIELPKIDTEVEQFEELTSVESVKAASDIFAPMSGKVLEVNTDLESTPGLINKDSYEKGWIVKLELADLSERSNLMSSEEYSKFLESLEE
jgi:glycine cleavage system H protein